MKAYEMASTTHLKFPQDIMLLFYAYYKRATQKNGFYRPGKDEGLRTGFKANALLQIENLTQNEAKIEYVKMVEEYIGEID